MDFLQLATQERWSCRAYSDEPVSDKDLGLVLEAARVAPTAHNFQPQRILVVRSTEALARLRAATRMTYGAPVVLAVCYDVDRAYRNGAFGEPDYCAGEMDCSIACTQMMLQAAELGLGTLWARGYNTAEVERALGIPADLRLVCLLDLGHPAADAKTAPGHTRRLSLAELAFEL